MKKKQKRNKRIDEMVEVFGYDYVIGYCLCSEYDVRKQIEKEEDAEKRKRLETVANIYRSNANKLVSESLNNEL